MASPFTFYRPTPYSPETKHQIWTTIFTDSHDEFCGCTEPFAHLADILIPPDHPDRQLTLDGLIKKNYHRQLCLFGGKGEKGGTGEGHTTKLKEEERKEDHTEEDPFTNINVEELLAAAAAEGEEER